MGFQPPGRSARLSQVWPVTTSPALVLVWFSTDALERQDVGIGKAVPLAHCENPMPLAKTGPGPADRVLQGKLAHGFTRGANPATVDHDFKQQSGRHLSRGCQPRAANPGMNAGPVALDRRRLICADRSNRCRIGLRFRRRALAAVDRRQCHALGLADRRNRGSDGGPPRAKLCAGAMIESLGSDRGLSGRRWPSGSPWTGCGRAG